MAQCGLVSNVTFSEVRRISRTLILHPMLEAMFKLRYPAILKVQTIFTPVFGPYKHTGEIRFRIKTMRKNDFFGVYIFCQNNWKSGTKRIHHEPFHVGYGNLTLGVGISFRDSAKPRPWLKFDPLGKISLSYIHTHDGFL